MSKASEPETTFPYSFAVRYERNLDNDMQAAVMCGLPMQETQVTWVQSLGWEDPPGVESGNHSSILAWKIAWTEESGGLQAMGS